MSKPPVYWHKAKKILSRKDPVLGKIIKKYNKGFLTTRGNPFFSLCRTVIGQQISTKAADSIWLKFEKKCITYLPFWLELKERIFSFVHFKTKFQ